MHRFPFWCPIAGLTFGLTLLMAASRATALNAIVPDDDIQRTIAAVPAAHTEAEMNAALGKLQAAAGQDPDRLVPQLLYFSMRARDVRAGMTAGVVIDRLHIAKDALLHAIVPYLDTTDPVLQRQLGNVLSAVDDAGEGVPRDFSLYVALLRHPAGGPPAVLVVHMIDGDPDRALTTLADALIDDAAARSALLRTAKSNDAAVIDTLLRDPRWWVRLAMVARMKREPALRTAPRLDQVRADTHPLVRAAARDLPQPAAAGTSALGDDDARR